MSKRKWTIDEEQGGILVSDLRTALQDEDLHDVHLQGKDGQTIDASRHQLAIRSPVFKGMLFGEFSESESSVVETQYDSEVLRIVVGYCYTDELDISGDDATALPLVIKADGAAEYYHLPGLGTKTWAWVASAFLRDPTLVCSAIREFSVSGRRDCPLSKLAFEVLRADPNATLFPSKTQRAGSFAFAISEDMDQKGIVVLDAEDVAKIIKDARLQVPELNKFTFLKRWVDADCEERSDQGREIASAINLFFINPSDLMATVEPSNLVTVTQLRDAYRAQAMKAEKGGWEYPDYKSKAYEERGKYIVEGAGASEVNGEYCYCTIHDGVPAYKKVGCGSDMYLVRTKKSALDQTRRWYLSKIAGAPPRPDNIRTFEYYSAPSNVHVRTPLFEYPTEISWTTKSIRGLSPPPNVTYHP